MLTQRLRFVQPEFARRTAPVRENPHADIT